MIPNTVRYGCTSLLGVNKVGTIQRDSNGYWLLVVGALNVYNSAGQLYVYDEAKSLFERSSQLIRRVERGALRGEYGHPKKLPGMSNEQFANRVFEIEEKNCCCHHKEIFLDFDRVKDKDGKPVIAIVSKVCPSGPFGPALEKSLNNPGENVCFSIRAFTDDFDEGRLTKRILRTIVTWDYVNEPGISVAEKYKSPALESMDDQVFNRNEIGRVIQATNSSSIGMESGLLTASELMESMGWNLPNSKPGFMNW